jgi:tRNA-splicing ligase RtcB
MIEYPGKYTTAKVMIDQIEQSCAAQITNFVNHPAFTNPIAIMPDTHAGKGSVIGFTMPMTDKTIPNVVGVDIGCFTQDTKVKLANNKELTMLELLDDFNANKDNYVFAKDDHGNIVITKILSVKKTRTVDRLAKVTLDNNETIYSTIDQIFYTRNNEETRADQLTVNQSLLPLYIVKVKDVVREQLSKINKCWKLKEYFVVYNPYTNLYDFIHLLADDYNVRHRMVALTSKFIRHHDDFNKYNNNPTNIVRMSWANHRTLHASHTLIANKDGSGGWTRTWQKHRDRFSKMSSEKMSALHKDPEFAKNLKIRAAKTFQEFCKTDKFKEMAKLAGKRGREYLIAYSKSEKGIKKSTEIGNRLYECPICHAQVKSAFGVFNHLKALKTDAAHLKLVFKDFKRVQNHSVKNIELIDCLPTDVYCLTIEEYSNFALAAGVFVHNCGMTSFNIGKSLSITLELLDHRIRQRVPFGMQTHENSVINMEKGISVASG